MARRRAQHAPVGLTSNGLVLLNVMGMLPPEQARRIRASLPRGWGTDWFVGVPLSANDATQLLARVDDAAAEAVARMRNATRSPKAKKRRARGT